MVGVGNDLQNGAFITLNGKQWKESFDDLVQAAQKANSIDITKGETLLAWATGNFDTDYNESFRNLFSSDIDLDLLAEFIKYMPWAAGQRGRCIRDHAALTCRFPFCRIILLL
mgnify:CR=1 FL=1|jgi:arabinogalactan endo-1,4-beta-galactosidase